MPLDPRFIEEAQALVIQRVKQEVPDSSVGDGGSAVNVIFARGASAVLAPLLQQQDDVIRRRSLSNLDALTDDDFSLIFENLLVDAIGGEKSRGFVNVYYATRETRTFPAGVRATTEDGTLGYVTQADFEFSPSDHFIDQESGDYFIRLPLIAEDEGEQYDADVGEINEFPGDATDSIRINNPAKFLGGVTADGKEESLAFAQRSVSTRTVLTPEGGVFAVQELFGSSLIDTLIIGMDDDEMTRDVLHDMGPTSSPRFKLGRSAIGGEKLVNDDGSPVHVGGRVDIYTWFRRINIAQQIIDLFADMQFVSTTSSAATTVVGRFVPGTTGTVAASGKLVLEAGTAREETVRYTSFSAVDDVYTFTLDPLTPTQFLHEVNTAIRVANNGVIEISDDGTIKLRPILQIKEIRLLDPVNFQVVGEAVPESDPDSRFPGWYITDRHESDSYSAKEFGNLVLDEKRTAAGNPPLSGTDGVAAVVGTFTELTSATTDFTGYQGRDITVVVGGNDVVRTVLAVKGISSETVVLDGDTSGIPAAGGYEFSIEDGAGDYIQHPIRVTFNTNTEIQELQTFLDGDSKRVVTDNGYARGYLPVFIDFTMRYKGDGSEEQVRSKVLEVVQQSAGSIVGQETTAQFDFSDLVNAAYEEGLANKVETPFQVRARYQNPDGTETIKYVHPDGDTVNNLAIRVAAVSGDQFVQTRRPDDDDFIIPERGYLRLGGFALEPNQVVEYVRVIEEGDDQTFVLKDGTTVGSTRPLDEQVIVHDLDYDPDNVIEDGTITSERFQRPYFGDVLFEKIS